MREDMVEVYRIYRDRVFQLLGYALIASLIAVGLNYIGLKSINLIAGIILPIIVAYIVTAPEVVLAVLGAGAALHPTTPVDSAGKTASAVGRFVAWLLLVLSFFFLVAGTLQFSRNPMAIFAIYLGIMVLFLVGLVWNMPTKLVKPLVYAYAFCVVAIGIGALISGSTYMKVFGFDPYWAFKVNPIDEQLDRMEKKSDVKEQQSLSQQLDAVEKKIEAGLPLDGTDKAVWNAAKKYSTLPGKLAAGLEKGKSLLSSSSESEKSSIGPVGPWQKVLVKPNETVKLTRVYDGDTLQYISPKGFRAFGDDEPDRSFYHNASSKPGEIRQFPLYDVPREGAYLLVKGEEGGESFELSYRIAKN